MKIIAALLLLVVVAQCAPLLHTDNPTAINGSYIVVLQEGSGAALRDAHIQKLRDVIAATNDNSEIGFVYNIGSFVGFSAKLSDSLLKLELSHPEVQYVEMDQIMRISADTEDTQTGATWGISRVSHKATWTAKTTYKYPTKAGAGVNVYVIDTGIHTTHTDFGGRASTGYNAITTEKDTDLNGHGTHCAGTIGGLTYGVAKAANLIAVKVLNAQGSGTNAGVLAGVNWVTEQFQSAKEVVPSVASMSLGGGISTALDTAVANSVNAGVAYSIAAGNSNANACNYSPARAADTSAALSVGSTDSTDTRSSFSNHGKCVTVFAPGSAITSDWFTSNTATNTISGTSMACPHVSGALALKLGDAGYTTPAALKAWVLAGATPAVVKNPGANSPNLLLYTLHDILN